jgi:hypothetical protein
MPFASGVCNGGYAKLHDPTLPIWRDRATLLEIVKRAREIRWDGQP